MDDIRNNDSEIAQISQDDIDRLLRGASEESVAMEGLDREGSKIEDLVTLDEIDRLLDIALESAEEIEDALDDEGSDGIKVIPRSDRDHIPGGDTGGKSVPIPEKAEPLSPNGLINQEDIDRMLNGVTEEIVAPSDAAPEEAAPGAVSRSGGDLPLSENRREIAVTPPSDDEPDGVGPGAISQSDIDLLLSGSDAEPSVVPPPGGAAEETSSGLVSQSDIDLLFSGSDAEPSVVPPPDGAAEETSSGLVSQSDIDLLFSGSDAEPSVVPPPGGAVEETSSGLVSQSDIDLLFSGSDAEPSVVLPPDGAAEESGSGMISQSDIDLLLSGSGEEGAESTPAGEGSPKEQPPSSLVTQFDIDQLLMSYQKSEDISAVDQQDANTTQILTQEEINSLLLEANQGETEMGFAEEEERSNFITQNELDQLLSEAVAGKKDVRESPMAAVDEAGLVSQDEIDRLMRVDGADGKTVALKPGLDKGDVVSQDEINRLMQDDGAGDKTIALKTGPDETEIISQDDIDQLLKGEDGFDETVALTPATDESEIISQDDIDRLLRGGDEGEGSAPAGNMPDPDDQIISQDDIDQLLREVDEEAPGETIQKAVERPKKDVVSQDEIDRLLKADEMVEEDLAPEMPAAVEKKPEEAVDRVILAEKEETESLLPRRAWYRSKYMLMAASVLLVVMASAVSLYLFQGRRGAPKPEIATDVVSRNIPKPSSNEPKKSSTIVHGLKIELKGFVVFAPVEREGVTFVTTDVSIDLKKTDSANEIIQHEAFYRSVVYHEISKELNETESTETDQAHLKKAIKKALNRALKTEAISKVELTAFKTV